MMDLTLIYYLAFVPFLSSFLSLPLTLVLSFVHLTRAYFKLPLRLSSHIRSIILRFPRHHLVDSLQSIFLSLNLKRLRCTDANP